VKKQVLEGLKGRLEGEKAKFGAEFGQYGGVNGD